MNHKTILLVEDNPDDEELTRMAFRKSNIANELIVARDGAEALEILFNNPAGKPRPAVVLLDLMLPKIGGLEVLRRIRENEETSMLPVVILTSSKEQEDIARSYRFGANSYIRKPVDFDQFVDAARQLGIYWLLLNEPPPEGNIPS